MFVIDMSDKPTKTDLERENARLRESQAFLRDIVTALVFSRGTRTAFVDLEGTKKRTPRPIIYTRTDKETKLLHIEIGESVTINPPNETERSRIRTTPTHST